LTLGVAVSGGLAHMNFFKNLAGGEEVADSAAGGWLASLKEKGKELAEVYKRDIGTSSVTPSACTRAFSHLLCYLPCMFAVHVCPAAFTWRLDN